MDTLQLDSADARDYIPRESLAIATDGLGLDRHSVLVEPSGQVRLESETWLLSTSSPRLTSPSFSLGTTRRWIEQRRRRAGPQP